MISRRANKPQRFVGKGEFKTSQLEMLKKFVDKGEFSLPETVYGDKYIQCCRHGKDEFEPVEVVTEQKAGQFAILLLRGNILRTQFMKVQLKHEEEKDRYKTCRSIYDPNFAIQLDTEQNYFLPRPLGGSQTAGAHTFTGLSGRTLLQHFEDLSRGFCSREFADEAVQKYFHKHYI